MEEKGARVERSSTESNFKARQSASTIDYERNGKRNFSTWDCHSCRRNYGSSVELNPRCPECNHILCSYCPITTQVFEKRRSVQTRYGSIRPRKTAQYNRKIKSGTNEDAGGNGSPREHAHSNSEQHNSMKAEPTSPSSGHGSPGLSNMNSDTEVETEFSNDDNMDSGIEITYEQHVMKVLDSRLLTTLQDHLDIAAIIIPRVHSSFDLLTPLELDFTSVPANSNEEKTSSPTQPNETKTSSSGRGGGRSYNQIQNRQKRSRKPEDEDEDEDTPRRKSFKQPQLAFDDRQISFACHWNKLGPLKYGERNPEGCENYQFCVNLDLKKGFRRIKDHFISRHVTSQCVNCRQFFFEKEERVAHEAASDCIKNELLPLKEGINNSQWTSIDNVIGKHRTRNTTQEEHDIEKWNKIWNIVFPKEPQPQHPFKDSYNTKHPSSESLILNVPAILSRFRRFIQSDRESEVFRGGDSMPETYALATEQFILEVMRDRVGTSPLLALKNDRVFDTRQAAQTMPILERDLDAQEIDRNSGRTFETSTLYGNLSFEPSFGFLDGYEPFSENSEEPQLPDQISRNFQHDLQLFDWNPSQMHNPSTLDINPSLVIADLSAFQPQETPHFYAQDYILQSPPILGIWDIPEPNLISQPLPVMAPDAIGFSDPVLELTHAAFDSGVLSEQWNSFFFDDAMQNEYKFDVSMDDCSTAVGLRGMGPTL